MRRLRINLKNEDLEENNLKFILNDIAGSIEKGFTSGIEFPVNWELKKEDKQDEIYFIYECNGHNEYSSYVIKHCVHSLKEAQEFYNLHKSSYEGENEDYNLILASFYGTPKTQHDGSDIRRDFRTILTTEE